MRWDLIEQAANHRDDATCRATSAYCHFRFGRSELLRSVFLALLLRCHKYVRSRGGEKVLCGTSPGAAELLRITALDTLWALYDTRDDALAAVD